MDHNDFWDNEDERCECEDCGFIRKSAAERAAQQIYEAELKANLRMALLMGFKEHAE